MPEGLNTTNERQRNIEVFTDQALEVFKGRLAGRSFSLSHVGGEYGDTNVTVVPDKKNPGQALWDNTSPDFLYVKRKDKENSGSISLNNILVSPEAEDQISIILKEMKIPPGMQEEVKKQIKKDYPPLN